MSVLTEVEIVKIRERYATIHVGEIGVLDVWEMGQTMTQLALKDVPNLLDTIDAKEKRIKVLEAKVAAIDALMSESTGVVGYHLNGEVATWEWLIDNWDVLTIKEAQDTTNMCPKCGKALMGKPLGCVIHGLVDPIEEAPDA